MIYKDPGVETLLDLHGEIIHQDDGYWIKIDAWRVDASEEVPHGIRYSLTLHDPYGRRILGYDNAHAVRPSTAHYYAGRIVAYDHRHGYGSREGVSYTYRHAHQLLTDFFTDVDRILQELGKG